MGHTNSGTRLSAFQTQAYPTGLDRHRCKLGVQLGTWKAGNSATFREGAPVMLNSAGEVVLFDAANGSTLLGVALAGKDSTQYSIVIDEAVTFGTSTALKTLDHPNISASSLVVRSAVEGGGTVYTITTDYTVNLTNGTITHVEAGIDEEAPVYVSYKWQLLESAYASSMGRPFHLSNDAVTYAGGALAVAQGAGGVKIFTMEYDADQIYSLTGATSNVYANTGGLFTSAASSAKLCGKVTKVPSNSDPFLGIDFIGQVAANS